MSPMESLARTLDWAGKNTSYNLGKLPADKLDWKPAPTANSALEIMTHIVGVLKCMQPVAEGGEWVPPDFTPITTLEEAQSEIERCCEKYAAAMRALRPEQLGEPVPVWGKYTFPRARAVSMPVVDVMHHHGQIAYLQTLLGDTEMHFYPEG